MGDVSFGRDIDGDGRGWHGRGTDGVLGARCWREQSGETEPAIGTRVAIRTFRCGLQWKLYTIHTLQSQLLIMEIELTGHFYLPQSERDMFATSWPHQLL